MYGINYNQDGFRIDEHFGWNNNPLRVPPHLMHRNRNNRYGNAFGNYCGGYPYIGMSGQYRPPFDPPNSSIPPLGWGGGLALQDPPMLRPSTEDKVIQFLIRCGVPKENTQNLPIKLLEMFEPLYCALCSIKLETFGNARMHYISKGHNKNQRKWLSECGNISKEIPLKSREIYCELCDIHITSRQHADSHYQGRTHRAIVEGRREPKNQALLHRNTQTRLQKIIRREKKILKSSNDPKKTANTKTTKPVTDVTSELYCDICKTIVTCSEQMRSHLNGKKHLTKEKRHILKMMTGELTNSGNKNDAVCTDEDKISVPDPVSENAEGYNTDSKDAGESDNPEQDEVDSGEGTESWKEAAED